MRIVIVILSLIILVSCGRQRDMVKLKNIRPAKLVAEIDNGQLDYDWYSAKIATSIEVEGKTRSFKTMVKMKKDSAIWLSVSPLLGIEIARLVIRPDSAFFIDKIKNEYYMGSAETLGQKLNINVDYALMQDMIVANAVMFDPDEKFKSKNDDKHYIVTSKTKRLVRKAVGINNRDIELETPDTVDVNLNERRYQRLIERSDDELIVKQYWISPEHFKPMKILISDIASDRSMESEYSDFEEINDALLPEKVSYTFVENDAKIVTKLKYSRIKIDVPTKLPFSIPKDFKPVSERYESN